MLRWLYALIESVRADPSIALAIGALLLVGILFWAAGLPDSRSSTTAEACDTDLD